MSDTLEQIGSHAEDYLKAIYLIHEKGDVSTGQLARELGVTAASVSSMLRRLASLRLVDYTPYRRIVLTPSGRKTALELIRHHRLLELFLYRVLGYGLANVHAEAEKLEHSISEEFEERIAKLLGEPLRDPHGSPIPDREGGLSHRPAFPLTAAAAGEQLQVCRLLHRDPQQLQFLESLGLIPDCRVRVLERKPFDGPLVLWIESSRTAGRMELVGHRLASQVLVLSGEGGSDR